MALVKVLSSRARYLACSNESANVI